MRRPLLGSAAAPPRPASASAHSIPSSQTTWRTLIPRTPFRKARNDTQAPCACNNKLRACCKLCHIVPEAEPTPSLSWLNVQVKPFLMQYRMLLETHDAGLDHHGPHARDAEAPRRVHFHQPAHLPEQAIALGRVGQTP